MKYATAITLLIAMGAAGCSESEPEETEAPERVSPEAAAAEAKRILESGARNDDTSDEARKPGFFGGGPARGRRKDDSEDQDTDPDQAATPRDTAATSQPAKRPPKKPAAPDEQAAKQVKLAELYIDNATAATSAARRKFLHQKAATILKEVISKHPKAPAATEAAKLLAEIELAQ